jgi:hypothetical protein
MVRAVHGQIRQRGRSRRRARRSFGQRRIGEQGRAAARRLDPQEELALSGAHAR